MFTPRTRSSGADHWAVPEAVVASAGRGRRFGNNVNAFVDRLIGGWNISGVGRVQRGRLLDVGNVRLYGVTLEDLRKAFKLRIVDDAQGNDRVYMLPQDIIDNTVRAFQVSATSPTGYGALGPPTGRYIGPANGPDCLEIANGFGDCGPGEVVVTGPLFKTLDLSFTKQTPIKGRVAGELEELLDRHDP